MKKLLTVIFFLILCLPCFAKKEFNFDEINNQITNFENQKDYRNAYKLIKKTKKKELNQLQIDLLNLHKDICIENIMEDKYLRSFEIDNDIYNNRKIYQYTTTPMYFFKPKVILYNDHIDIDIRLELKYIGFDYYNFQRGAINLNNKNYKFSLINAGEKVSSCDSLGCVYREYRIIDGIDKLQLLKELSNYGKTSIRVYGTNYYKDYKLLDAHITNINATLALYYYLKKQLN